VICHASIVLQILHIHNLLLKDKKLRKLNLVGPRAQLVCRLWRQPVGASLAESQPTAALDAEVPVHGVCSNCRPLLLGPLELLAALLPGVLAHLSVTCPDTRVEVRHASSPAQLAALRMRRATASWTSRWSGTVAPILLTTPCWPSRRPWASSWPPPAGELASPARVRLHELTGLPWIDFPRSDTPTWHDRVTATLRGHGISVGPPVGFLQVSGLYLVLEPYRPGV
jgi:hypothetical protein